MIDSNNLMLDPRLEIRFLKRFASLLKDAVLPNVSAKGSANLQNGIKVDRVGKLGIPLCDQDFEEFMEIGKQIDQSLWFIEKDAVNLSDQWIVDLDVILGTLCDQLKLVPKDLDVPCLGLLVYRPGDSTVIPKVNHCSNGFYMLVQIPDQREPCHSSIIVTALEDVAQQKFLLDSPSNCPYPFRYVAYQDECSVSISCPTYRAFLLFHIKPPSPIPSLPSLLNISLKRLKLLLENDFSSEGICFGVLLEEVVDVCRFDSFNGVYKCVYQALQKVNAALLPVAALGFRLVKLEKLEVHHKFGDTGDQYYPSEKSSETLTWYDSDMNVCPYSSYLGLPWNNLTTLSSPITLENAFEKSWWGLSTDLLLDGGSRKECSYKRFAIVFFRKSKQFEILVERSPEATLNYLLKGDSGFLQAGKLKVCFEKVLENWKLANHTLDCTKRAVELIVHLNEHYLAIKLVAKLAHLVENKVNVDLFDLLPLVKCFGYERLSRNLDKLIFQSPHALKFVSKLLESSLITITNYLSKKFYKWYKAQQHEEKLDSALVQEALSLFSQFSDRQCLPLVRLDFAKHASLFDRDVIKTLVGFNDGNALKMFLNRLIAQSVDWRTEHSLLIEAGERECIKKCLKFILVQPEPLVIVEYLHSVGISKTDEPWVTFVRDLYAKKIDALSKAETLAAFKFFKVCNDYEKCTSIVKNAIEKEDCNDECFWVLLSDLGSLELVKEYFSRLIDTNALIKDHTSFRDLMFALLLEYGKDEVAEQMVQVVFNQKDFICYYLDALLEKIDSSHYELWAYLILENVYDLSLNRQLSLHIYKLFQTYFSDPLCRMLTECFAEKLSVQDLKAVMECLVDKYSIISESDVLYPIVFARYSYLKSLVLVKPDFELEMVDANYPDPEIQSFLRSSEPELELSRFKSRKEASEFIQDNFCGKRPDGFSVQAAVKSRNKKFMVVLTKTSGFFQIQLERYNVYIHEIKELEHLTGLRYLN